MIRDLEPNSEYAFHVAAFNKYGDGEHAVSKRIVTGGRRKHIVYPSFPYPETLSSIAAPATVRELTQRGPSAAGTR